MLRGALIFCLFFQRCRCEASMRFASTYSKKASSGWSHEVAQQVTETIRYATDKDERR
jgi:hypothetical protein